MRRILYLQGYCDELDDGVQEVFIKVYRATLPRQEAFAAWFYRLIVNTGRDMGRRRKTRVALVDRLHAVAPERSTADAPSAPDTALRTCLSELSPELREAVALRFFADLSLEQIAHAQSVPLGTVKSRLHAAMSKLRAALTTSGYESS